jgi:hypothetical protein
LILQVYDSGGSLDTGSNDAYMWNSVDSSATPTPAGNGGANTVILSGNMNSTTSISGELSDPLIQRVVFQKVSLSTNYLDSTGTKYLNITGVGVHKVVGPITGFRPQFSSGNISGGTAMS